MGDVLNPASVSLPLPFFPNLGSQSNMSVHAGGVPSLRLKRPELKAYHSYLVPTLLMNGVLRLLRYEILWPVNGRIYSLATCKSLPGSRVSSLGKMTTLRDTLKGKAVPLQAWSGPEGSRKLRFPNFMTTAQDGGKVVSLKHRLPLPPGNTPGIHFC